MINKIKNDLGFTIIELVIVIVILGLISAYAIPKMTDIIDDARTNATKDEMMKIKLAIVGDATAISGGVATSKGFLGDVGRAPNNISELYTQGAIPSWDRTANNGAGAGWNGPYIKDDDFGSGNYEDAWGTVYNVSTTEIRSAGNDMTFGTGDDIILAY